MESYFAEIVGRQQVSKEWARAVLKEVDVNPLVLESIQQSDPSLILRVIDVLLLSESKELSLQTMIAIADGAKIGYPSSRFGKYLVELITEMIEGSCGDDIMKIQFLAVCLRDNIGIRMFIQEQTDIYKPLCRCLTLQLNQTDLVQVLYNMSVLVRLVLHEDSIRQKLFQAQNIRQAIDLILTLIQNNTYSSRIQLDAIHLLEDFCAIPVNVSILEQHEPFLRYLEQSSVNRVGLKCFRVCAELSHALRQKLVDRTDTIVEYILDPNQTVAIACSELVLILVKETTEFVTLLGQKQQLLERINGFLQSFELEDRWNAKYLLARHLTRIYTAICRNEAIAKYAAETLNIGQVCGIVQREASLRKTGHHNASVPVLSIALLSFMAQLAHQSQSDALYRSIYGLLQSSSVSRIVAAGLCQAKDKACIQEMLLFIQQVLSHSKSHHRFAFLSLSDGIMMHNQSVVDIITSLQADLVKAQTTESSKAKVLQLNTNKMHELTQELYHVKRQGQIDLEACAAKSKVELEQKDESLKDLKRSYETQLKQLKDHCEHLNDIVRKKLDSNDERDRLLQENRDQRCAVEQLNCELRKKLHLMEVRLDEVAQAHSIAREEVHLRDKEYQVTRQDMETLSETLTTQGVELDTKAAQCIELEQQVKEFRENKDSLYQELVLLARVYEQDKKKLSELTELYQHQEQKVQELSQALEKTTRRAEDYELQVQIQHQSAMESQHHITELEQTVVTEKAKCESLIARFETAQVKIDKLETELADQEVRLAQVQLQVEEKNAELASKDAELQTKVQELGKQSKLQALIHKLSSGDDDLP